MATQFYLTLPSNSSMAYFPNNTVANFRVRLAETIVLPGQWEVALAGLHYPHTWTTLRHAIELKHDRAKLADYAVFSVLTTCLIQKRYIFITKISAVQDLNLRPSDLQSLALSIYYQTSLVQI